MTRQEKIDIAIIHLINHMFIIAGHSVTYDDIKDRQDQWFTEWTMTMEQNKKWQLWGIEYLRKNLKLNKKVAEREMAMINLMWGLKYSDFAVN